MNAKRRKELESIISEFEKLKERVDLVLEEEQEARSNLPDSLEDSDRAYAMDDNISDLENSSSNIQDAIDEIQEVIER